MTKFETGKIYATRSPCDHNCVVRVTVTGRTAKTIKTPAGALRIKEIDGEEFVFPWGKYSMAPMVGASDAMPS